MMPAETLAPSQIVEQAWSPDSSEVIQFSIFHQSSGLVPHDGNVGSSQNRLLTSSIYTATTRGFLIIRLSSDMQRYLSIRLGRIQEIRASFEDDTVEKVAASILRTANNFVMRH
jgi:hypothetical protein